MGKISNGLHYMANEKNLVIYGGILTLISIYFLTWFTYILGTRHYANGMGGIQNLIHIFTNSEEYTFAYGVPLWVTSLMVAFIITVLACGFMQLCGKKSYFLGYFGSIIALLLGLMIIVGEFIGLVGFHRILFLFGGDPLIEPIIPFQIVINGMIICIGGYFLIAGGIIGLFPMLGGLKKRE